MADATGFDAAFPYRAVLFDLDGTLVDTEDDIVEAVNRTLGDWRLGPRTATEVHGWIGEGARMLIERAFRAAGSDADIDAVMPDLMRHYAETLLLGARLYPGAEPVLRGLRARGVRLALCTNKPSRFLLPLMRHLGVADVFDAMVGGDSLPRRKPDALPLLHIAEGFGLPVAQCLMVGDSETDARAAHAAGMPLALVAYGYHRGFDVRGAGAVVVLDDLRGLLALDATA